MHSSPAEMFILLVQKRAQGAVRCTLCTCNVPIQSKATAGSVHTVPAAGETFACVPESLGNCVLSLHAPGGSSHWMHPKNSYAAVALMCMANGIEHYKHCCCATITQHVYHACVPCFNQLQTGKKKRYTRTPILHLLLGKRGKRFSSRPAVPAQDAGLNHPRCCNPWQSCHRSSAFLQIKVQVYHCLSRQSLTANAT